MTTEAAFLMELQHEYLHDAHGRIAACLEALPAFQAASCEEGLRTFWQMTHVLKGEAQVVGFAFLARHLEAFEDALGHVGEELAKARAEATAGGEAPEVGEKGSGLEAQAVARLVSALAEACYGVEAYVRALERDYTDGEALLETHEGDFGALVGFQEHVSLDWGMDAASGVPEETVALDDLGDGIRFDADVFHAHRGKENTRLSLVPSPGESPPLHAASDEHASLHGPDAPALVHDAGETKRSAFGIAPASSPIHESGRSPQRDKGRAQPVSSEARGLFLMVKQGGLDFAVPLEQVVEIVDSRRWNPLPVRKRNILGVINLRGSVLPIVDFQAALGVPATLAPTARCIVVLSVGGRRFGIGVEAVTHVSEVSSSQRQRIEDAGLGLGETPLTEMALVDGRTVLFLDMARFVA